MFAYLAGRQLHIGLDEHARVIGLANFRKRDPDAVRIERLALTFDQPRLDSGTLYVDSGGLIALIDMIGATCKSGRALHKRLCAYFPGESNFDAMIRATVRAMLADAAPAIGEAAYYLQRVRRQLDEYVII